ncbi:acetyl-CoA acetyltransferase [Mycolicibacterium peregrinum]|uniref:acetyl-CoA acetyltransferase n=1 Tax=Mycolicibacterium peregrinum TaxID=43304 RepID=UPI0006D774A0|nr:acetyl-CoA acetyltransferase [Mycolicibacterium peregrinum]MCV7205364.1 acetyl-CoA acetyltransferase [Mycolicibacterium peregrinum]ORW54974.1 acetyl-CoA acetyltransferase [Mycolicibacterium peregrinum]
MVDPRTPVIVGVGQFTERIDLDGYRGMSSVELATEAARAAVHDCGADSAAVAQAIDTVAGTRQFEISGPQSATLGVSNNYPRSVARNVGAEPARAILEVIGGQSPQHLVTEFAGAIAAGEADVVLLFGSENTSTLRHFSKRDDKPDHSETIDGQLEDRGFGYDGIFDEYTIKHGLIGAPVQYGLLENARRARLGLSVSEYRQAMAELFAPFSKVAAKNPYSSAPVERSAEELATVTESNRMICDPYPRMMVARDQVNQGAAVLLMSVESAQKLGVPEEKWVYLRGHADMKEIKLLERAELGYSEAAVIAVNEALRIAGIGLDDVAAFDLYSCFPFPVFNICDGTGLAPDDERGLTLTGGLPFFGGPGNNYSMHGIAEAVNEMRDKPGKFALVGGNGGIASKYSVGIYSTEPADWLADGSAALQAEFNAQQRVAITEKADGPATIETYTVRYDWTPRTGIIIGRLDSDGSRFLATTTDDALVQLLSEGEPLGASIIVESGEKRNTATPA